MIEYIKGELAEVTPALAVVDCQGIGYGISISLNTYSEIQGKKDVKLWIYEAIREDAHQLFGFASKLERDLFVQLISVSGIGGNTARMILSALTPSELYEAISTGNEKVLKTVKGIGLKTAQRIIVDLKDKIVSVEGATTTVMPGKKAEDSLNKEVFDEALAALSMLGFPPAPSHKVVSAILKEEPTLPVEQVIKQALKRL